MFKMAKKILTFDGKSSSSPSPASSNAAGSSSAPALAKPEKEAKKSGDELNDFSKLEQDPRLPLNVRQIFKITKSWKAIARTMSKTGTAMFLNLFEQNQDLFYLFDRFQHLKGRELHESMELREHAATVMATLDQSINSLSDYDNFVTYLHSIGKFHRKVPGFRRAYFWKIEQPFLKAVKQTLDERCNETIEEIYKIAIKLIIETISEGYGEDKPEEAKSGEAGDRDKGGGGGASGGGGDGGAGRPKAHAAPNDNNNNSSSSRDDNDGRPSGGRQHAGGGPRDNGGREIRLGGPASGSTTATSTPASAGQLQTETKLGPTLFVLRRLLLALMASERGKQGPRSAETTKTAGGGGERRRRLRLWPSGSRVEAPGEIGKGCRQATRGSGSLINCQARSDSPTTRPGEQQQELKRGHNQHNSRSMGPPGEANSSQPANWASNPRRDTWKLARCCELELNNKTGGRQINGHNSLAGPEATDHHDQTWRPVRAQEMSPNDGVPADLKSPREPGEMKERSLSIVSRLRIKQSSVKPSDEVVAAAAAAAGNHHFPQPAKVCTRSARTKAASRPKSKSNANANANAVATTKLRLSTDPDDLKELIKLLMLAASHARPTAAT